MSAGTWRVARVTLPFVLAVLAACGGGGGTSAPTGTPAPAPAPAPSAAAPVIANLTLDSKGAYQDPTISTTNVNGSFTIVSPGTSAITAFSAVIYNAAGQNVGQISAPVQQGSGSVVTFTVNLILAQLQTGVYSFNVSLQNAAGASSNALSGTYSYLPNPWTTVPGPAASPGLRFPRYWTAVTEANGKLYVIGGMQAPQGSPGSRFVDIFDPVSRTWSQAPNAPSDRGGARAVVVDGKVYLIGGYDAFSRTPFAEVEVLDLATGQWTQAPPLPMPRYLSAIAVLDKKIYVLGGTQTPDAFSPLTIAQPMNRVDVFDTASGTWSTAPALPEAVLGAAATAVNGAIYLSGGTLASGTVPVLSANVRAFTPASGTWVQVGNHPAGRTNHALIAASGKLFAVGGNMIINTVLGGTLATESATVPATPAEGISFKQSAALNQIATSATAVTIGGKVYMFSNSPVYILTPELDVL